MRMDGALPDGKDLCDALQEMTYSVIATCSISHNNAMYDAGGGPCILKVQEAMLDGEIEYRKAAVKKSTHGSADFTKAFDLLRSPTR